MLLECEGNPTLLKARFFGTGDAAADGSDGCELAEIRLFLWLHIKIEEPTWEVAQPSEERACPDLAPKTLYALGHWAYLEGRREDMGAYLRRCVKTAFTPHETYIALQGMGVYHQLAGNHDSAYVAFVDSYTAAQDEMDAIGLNNLANAALMANRWKAALDWAKRAEDEHYNRLRSGLPASYYPEGLTSQILSNRLLAEMKLGLRADAQATFNRMRLDELDGYNAVMGCATATAFLLWQGDRKELERLKPLLESGLSQDSALAVEVMAAHALLFAPWFTAWQGATGMDWEETWYYVQSCPQELRDLAHPHPAEEAEVSPESRPWLRWTSAAFWAIALVAGGAAWREQRRVARWSVQDLVQILDRSLNGTTPPRPGRYALRLLHLRAPLMDPKVTKHLERQLTPRELDVLHEWVNGVRAKESAANFGITVSAVYNARAIVRKKLEVPEGMDVKAWYEEHMRDQPHEQP